MKFLTCEVQNFGSYPDLHIDFRNIGLGLIHGATGSGKSTIPDMPCWVLFGITAKDGAVDEVRSWQSPGEPTTGTLTVEIGSDEVITVERVRGKQSENDLCWYEGYGNEGEPANRGKDINETQKLLEKRLGVSADLYLAGAYYHEFSSTGTFFTAKAKDRRAIFEKIASLELPARLATKASEARKQVKVEIDSLTNDLSKQIGKLEQLETVLASSTVSANCWDKSQGELIVGLKAKVSSFEIEKEQRVVKLQARADGFETEKNARIDRTVARMEDLELKEDDWYAEELQSRRDALDLLLADEIIISEVEGEVGKLLVRLTTLEMEYEKLSAPKSEICPTCMGPTDNDNCSQYLKKIVSDISDIKILKDVTTVKADDLRANYNDSKNRLTNEISKLQQDSQENKRNAERYEDAKRELSQIMLSDNPFIAQVEGAKAERNIYSEQLEFEKTLTNPFAKQVSFAERDILATKENLRVINSVLSNAAQRLSGLSRLYDLSYDLRGELLKKAVKDIEASTNRYLETYFDAEIRVGFSLEGSDSLEVAILKSGYPCTYKQLSKGQRGLLKLSFTVSIMAAASNKAGIHFDNLFMDEALDGLDTSLKLKAFGLFEELATSHESVLVIDHCEELKQLFNTKYHVTMEADKSVLEIENE